MCVERLHLQGLAVAMMNWACRHCAFELDFVQLINSYELGAIIHAAISIAHLHGANMSTSIILKANVFLSNTECVND